MNTHSRLAKITRNLLLATATVSLASVAACAAPSDDAASAEGASTAACTFSYERTGKLVTGVKVTNAGVATSHAFTSRTARSDVGNIVDGRDAFSLRQNMTPSEAQSRVPGLATRGMLGLHQQMARKLYRTCLTSTLKISSAQMQAFAADDKEFDALTKGLLGDLWDSVKGVDKDPNRPFWFVPEAAELTVAKDLEAKCVAQVMMTDYAAYGVPVTVATLRSLGKETGTPESTTDADLKRWNETKLSFGLDKIDEPMSLPVIRALFTTDKPLPTDVCTPDASNAPKGLGLGKSEMAATSQK
jgi:hypothetical protein